MAQRYTCISSAASSPFLKLGYSPPKPAAVPSTIPLPSPSGCSSRKRSVSQGTPSSPTASGRASKRVGERSSRKFNLRKYFDRMGLRPLERLVLAASIVSTKSRKKLTQQAQAVIQAKWTKAILSLRSRPSFDHADLSPSQVAKLLSNLLSDPPADVPVLDAPQRHEVLFAAWTKYGPDITSPILQQIFTTIR
jgi:hypothetical protein